MSAEVTGPTSHAASSSGERQRADERPLAGARGYDRNANQPLRSSPPRRPRWFSQALAGLRWAAPGVGLALIPKCPMCVAGYIALGTGLSVSFPVAEGLRTGMFVACFAALGWMIVAKVRRHLGRAQAQRCC